MIASLSKKLFEKLRRRSYRASYVAEHVRTGISYQIRTLLSQRGWAQKRLAKEMNKPASVISRLVNPDYGKLNVQTLLEVAAAFDVGLVIKFVSFPEFLRRTRDVSPEALEAKSFDEKQFKLLPDSESELIMPSRSTANVIVARYGGTTKVDVPSIAIDEQSIRIH
jgi:transcriptional regulator with XRE-family HTH domain